MPSEHRPYYFYPSFLFVLYGSADGGYYGGHCAGHGGAMRDLRPSDRRSPGTGCGRHGGPHLDHQASG